jgi:methyl-accepting chemotaxis protein
MNNLRLAVKIGGGFGIVLALACILGIVAVARMEGARAHSGRIKAEYVPEVIVAGNLERHLQAAMFAMRGYVSFGKDEHLSATTKEIGQVDKYLSEAQTLSETYPGLKALREGLGQAKERVAEYQKLLTETKTRMVTRRTGQAERLRVATRTLKRVDDYQKTAKEEFGESLAGGASASLLLRQWDRIEQAGKLVDAITAIRMKELSGDARSDIAQYEEALSLFQGAKEIANGLRGSTSNQSQIEVVDGVVAGVADYAAVVADQVKTAKSLQELSDKRTRAAQSVLESVRAIADAGTGSLARLAEESDAGLGQSLKIMEGGLLVAVLVGAFFAVIITRSIVGPVRRGVEFAGLVAGGDYGHTLDISQKDEIGELAGSLNAMVASLKEQIGLAEAKSAEAGEQAAKARAAMAEAEESRSHTDAAMAHMIQVAGELQKVAEVLTTASEQLSAQVEQSSHGAASQAQRVGETATAMEEMNATVLEVAKSAGQASEMSAKARAKAEEGAAVVSRVVESIRQVEDQAVNLKKDMGALGVQAESIGAIMNVISDIADQTNLLALNAAIEAARAGDAGRGFAVVADEVRKLAEKTMNATREVGEAISGIQQGARASIDSVEAAVHTIETATGLAGQSGEALAGIVSLVDTATDQVRSIATASEQQSSASEQINRSIEEVSTISSETAQAMHQAAQAVGELARQAVVLRDLVEGMRAGRG